MEDNVQALAVPLGKVLVRRKMGFGKRTKDFIDDGKLEAWQYIIKDTQTMQGEGKSHWKIEVCLASVKGK